MNATNSLHDPLDATLSRYFQAQMPRSWPSAPMPTELASTPTRSQRGRFTMTAAVAVLLALVMLISYGPSARPEAGPKTDHLKDSTADGNKFKAILEHPSDMK